MNKPTKTFEEEFLSKEVSQFRVECHSMLVQLIRFQLGFLAKSQGISTELAEAGVANELLAGLVGIVGRNFLEGHKELGEEGHKWADDLEKHVIDTAKKLKEEKNAKARVIQSN